MRLYVWLLIVAFFNNGIQAQEVVQDTIVHSEMVQDTIVHGEMMRDTLPQGHIDDHLQYLPITGVFALPNLGMEPAHNLKERVLIGATAYAMTAVFVNSLKYSIRQLRPDNSAHNSFPSGHTATVFTGVEMLYQEYKHSEPWVGITGYVVATGVGLLRIYNNRHWASDVVAGAGIGILSTKLSYLLFPYTSKLLQSKKERIAGGASSLHMLAFPTYDAKTQGIGMGVVVSF